MISGFVALIFALAGPVTADTPSVLGSSNSPVRCRGPHRRATRHKKIYIVPPVSNWFIREWGIKQESDLVRPLFFCIRWRRADTSGNKPDPSSSFPGVRWGSGAVITLGILLLGGSLGILNVYSADMSCLRRVLSRCPPRKCSSRFARLRAYGVPVHRATRRYAGLF